jgi:hypothetical protein
LSCGWKSAIHELRASASVTAVTMMQPRWRGASSCAGRQTGGTQFIGEVQQGHDNPESEEHAGAAAVVDRANLKGK